MKTIKTSMACAALVMFWAVPGFAQATSGSDSKTGDGKSPATGQYTRKKMPGRMKSGQITAKADSKGGNRKQPDIAVKGAGVPKDTAK
jgi:hypothetical protein